MTKVFLALRDFSATAILLQSPEVNIYGHMPVDVYLLLDLQHIDYYTLL